MSVSLTVSGVQILLVWLTSKALAWLCPCLLGTDISAAATVFVLFSYGAGVELKPYGCRASSSPSEPPSPSDDPALTLEMLLCNLGSRRSLPSTQMGEKAV